MRCDAQEEVKETIGTVLNSITPTVSITSHLQHVGLWCCEEEKLPLRAMIMIVIKPNNKA